MSRNPNQNDDNPVRVIADPVLDRPRFTAGMPPVALVIWLGISSVATAEGGTIAPLKYSVSWIGNTFSGGDAGWVPQDVTDIFVTPDGTVYTTVGWEEHRGNIAAFRGGKLIQQTAHWKRGGIDRHVGDAICVTNTRLFFATDKGAVLARRDRGDFVSKDSEKRVGVTSEIVGLAASEDRVFASCKDGRIRVYDAELRPIADWAAPSPGKLARDARGDLWIIDTRERVIRAFDARGKLLDRAVRLGDTVEARDVAVAPDGRLLVADAGPNRRVLIYRDLETKPVLERTFGEPGGVFSGPTPGMFGDRRFVSPVGVGSDAEGNIYVACGPYAGTQGGTAIIQSYSPEGRLNWRVMSTEWLDTVDADRASDGKVLYGSKYRYSLDLSRPPGGQWSLRAVTLHPEKYPDDPRLKAPNLGGVWHRRIQDQSYLFFPDMNGGNLYVFRLNPEREGEIAVFCAQVSTKELWVDWNGDGRKDPGEIEENPTGETRGWFVEQDGTIWQATRGAGIFEYPLAEILDSGVPVFRLADRRRYEMPSPFTELRRIVYDRERDEMYLGGSTAEARAEHWKPMGPNLVRFDDWRGARRIAWRVVLPHEKGRGGHLSHEPFDLAVEGDYVFVVYAGTVPSRNLPYGTVVVCDRGDGRQLGHFQPTGTRTGDVPMDALQDMVHSLNVFRRADGEYLIFIEDDGYTKNILYRWKP